MIILSHLLKDGIANWKFKKLLFKAKVKSIVNYIMNKTQ